MMSLNAGCARRFQNTRNDGEVGISRHAHRAFTLVELLVVIAIIAVLLSILMPTISRAKSHAYSIKCLSNLKSLGQAALMYANDNKGWIPRDWVPDFQDQTTPQVLLPEVCAKYLGHPQDLGVTGVVQPDRDRILAPIFAKMPVLQCPTLVWVKEPVIFTHPLTGKNARIDRMPWCYVVNAMNFRKPILDGKASHSKPTPTDPSPSDWSGITKITSIKNTSAYVYIIDSAPVEPLAYSNFGYHDICHIDRDLGYIPGVPSRVIFDNRHPGGSGIRKGMANAAFFDGHAESIRRATISGRLFHPNGRIDPPPTP